jgi:hypothetical protein
MYAIPKSESGLETKYYKSYENDLYTGLTDKDKKDIYEKDIVRHYVQSEFLDEEDWEIIEGEVKLINGLWCVKDEKYPLYGFENEIIGNVYSCS